MENNTVDIRILRLVAALDAAVAAGDVRRADTLTDLLFRLQGGRDEDAVMPDYLPMDIRTDAHNGVTLTPQPDPTQKGHPMKKRSIRRLTVAAAVVVLVAALSVTALATRFFGLRDLVLSGDATPAVSTSPAATASDADAVEYAVQTPAPPKQDLIAMQGYPGSAEYKAASAWNTFCAGYDTDHAILNQVGNSSNEYTERYPMYLVYSKDMADALEAIVTQYGLKLHTSITIAESADGLYDLAGTGPFLDGATGGVNRMLGGYVYNDGTFHYDGMAVLFDGSVIDYQLGNYVKGTFSDTYLNVGDASAYSEWTYKTASGVAVSLALGGGKALVIADLPDSFVTVNVLAGTTEDTFADGGTIDQKTLESFADTIDFSQITR